MASDDNSQLSPIGVKREAFLGEEHQEGNCCHHKMEGNWCCSSLLQQLQ